MKVEFIDSTYTRSGYKCVRLGWHFVAGYYNNKCFSLNRKKRIVVVRQKSKWKTFMILCHEFMHWLFDTLLPKRIANKCHDWLDR